MDRGSLRREAAVRAPEQGNGTRYRLYGLIVDTSLSLAGERVRRSGPAHVRLRKGHRTHFDRARRSLGLTTTARDWFECHRLPNGVTYLRWDALFEFLIARDGRTIKYRRLRNATSESLTTYLLGQVLSFSLLSYGCDPLHATAVVIDGEAVAFLGNCGYGKSTLGAAFVARGFPILTDDVLALRARNGRWMAHAGPQRVKLFPSVARKVLTRSTGDVLNPDTSKLVLPLRNGEAASRTVPVKALYVLSDPKRRRSAKGSRVHIAQLRGPAAFLALTRSAFNLIQTDRPRLANHFTTAARLAAEVPLKRLVYPRRFDALDTVCNAVLQDARRMGPQRVSG
jgi:hypothetical protein